ncbi:co-chaperone YbbN [Citricoccus sp. SGAir0253]|nr:co-chaperone YbbN [Citricoccus sp. SGAir0253]
MPSHLRGAVDLSGLQRSSSGARPAGPAAVPGTARPGAGPAGRDQPAEGTWVLDGVRQADLQQLVQLSGRVPVLIHLAAPSDPVSGELDALLAPEVDRRGGRLVLARIDTDAEPQALQAFGLAAGPAVVAVLGGQPIPVLNQAVPAEQLAQLLDELLAAAAQNGMTGAVPPLGPPRDRAAGGEAAAPPPLPPLHQEAIEAIDRGDYAAATDAYRRALAENPGDEDARIGLSQAGLFARTATMDAAAVRERAAGAPDDVQAQLDVADLDLLGGHVEDAFARLVRFIAAHPGPERNTAREHLVDLYAVVGDQDPRTAASRKALARALF